MPDKIKIAISSCLLGNAVRYDGLDKRNSKLLKDLTAEFKQDELELIAVCPEVMAGLGVPRPAVQLVKADNEIHALGVNDQSLDVSSAIVNVAKEFVHMADGLCGLILKSRSPSCGLGSTELFDQDKNVIGFDSGLFARYVSEAGLNFPIVEDSQLDDVNLLTKFCQQVRNCPR